MTELEKQDIHGTDWDYLIVLDACRYDTFEEVYTEYLEGDLEKKKTRGTATPEWLWNTFESSYDYTYISAITYINNRGIDLQDKIGECPESWVPDEHFSKIIEAWDTEWNKELDTVHPRDLTNLALKENDEKTIIHYVQPHRPYISADINKHTWWMKKELENQDKSRKRQFFEKTRKLWKPIFTKMPSELQKRTKNLLGVGNSFEELLKEVGEEKVKQYYREDLELALKEIKRFVEEVDGKIIITADHGELLGENGKWEHHIGGTEPQLTEVPWMEVKN